MLNFGMEGFVFARFLVTARDMEDVGIVMPLEGVVPALYTFHRRP